MVAQAIAIAGSNHAYVTALRGLTSTGRAITRRPGP
jgi:hypothetical protein